MRFASRISQVPPYLFVEISRKIAEKRAQGVEVISFGIGDPDLPTPDNVVSRLREAALDAPNHRYPETDGLPEMRRAITEIASEGTPVVLASRVAEGRVIGSEQQAEAGIVAAGDLPPHKARVLLMLALLQSRDAKEIQAIFDTH